MREEIANVVDPILNYGLDLQERLERGERPALLAEQTELKTRLMAPSPGQRHPDYGGESDPGSATVSAAQARMGRAAPSGGRYLGIRYALTCWLDEIFGKSPLWQNAWPNQTLESALFGTNDGPSLFWEQAAYAESRSGADAVEGYLLCVLLGFRGDRAGQPEQVKAWVQKAQTKIANSQKQDWPYPPELNPPSNPAPRFAEERFRRMVAIAGLVLVALVPVAAVIAARFFPH